MTFEQTRDAITRNVSHQHRERLALTGAAPALIVLVAYDLWRDLYRAHDVGFSPNTTWHLHEGVLHVFTAPVHPVDVPFMPSPDSWRIVIDSGVGSHQQPVPLHVRRIVDEPTMPTFDQATGRA